MFCFAANKCRFATKKVLFATNKYSFATKNVLFAANKCWFAMKKVLFCHKQIFVCDEEGLVCRKQIFVCDEESFVCHKQNIRLRRRRVLFAANRSLSPIDISSRPTLFTRSDKSLLLMRYRPPGGGMWYQQFINSSLDRSRNTPRLSLPVSPSGSSLLPLSMPGSLPSRRPDL